MIASKMLWNNLNLEELKSAKTYELLEKASIIYYNFGDKKTYSYFPLGQIVLTKIESIIRQEMSRYGIQELYLPPIQPHELWKVSERNKDFDAIYIGGGNTFKLLSELRNTGFIYLLEKFIKGNGLVYGGSAGAIIMGKNILTTSDENKIGLKIFHGLDLIKNYSIWCHYKNSQERLVFDYVKKYNNPVITITEKGGVFFNGKYLEIIGSEPVHLFTGNISTLSKPYQKIEL